MMNDRFFVFASTNNGPVGGGRVLNVPEKRLGLKMVGVGGQGARANYACLMKIDSKRKDFLLNVIPTAEEEPLEDF